MSSFRKTPYNYSRRYRMAIQELWRQIHILPPSPPLSPTRSPKNSLTITNSLSPPSPSQNPLRNQMDDGLKDVNPFGGGNPLLTKETESEPIIWDIGHEEEEYPSVNKYPSFKEEPIMFVEDESCPVYDTDNEEEESMSVYDIDIEDVIEEEEGLVKKGGIGGEEYNIEDFVVVANDICYSMIQTTLSIDFEEDINTKSHGLMSFG
uniref:Uncharacterized protein n=1 Tax=Tanacetum cinerariifolium TaxID=118510 RepID=A0A6L2NVD7_TANCI|nr:hypothetical protein [Tanacetum cinerariifolium]